MQKSSKTAWIIVGPESSGSKFIAKHIADINGIKGWDGSFISESDEHLVYHRSCPFQRPKNYSPQIIREIQEIRNRCDILNIIFTTRDKNISASSKSRRFGRESIHETIRDINEAEDLYLYLSSFESRVFIWSYETMLLLGKSYFDTLYSFFNLDTRAYPRVIDGNARALYNSALRDDEYRDIRLVYNVNLFRKAEAKTLCDTQLKTVESLNIAANASINRNLQIIVSSSERDYQYLKNLFSNANSRVNVRLLGRDSRTRTKPYLRDILLHSHYDVVFNFGFDASHIYCIYANADICVPNYFFEFIFQQLFGVTRQCEEGRYKSIPPDCFVINRRDIVNGNVCWHPGSDLFIFPAGWLKTMSFGNVSIGLPPMAPILWINCLYHSRRAIQISDLFITRHYGSEEEWRSPLYSMDTHKNHCEAACAFKKLLSYDIKNISRIDLSRHQILPRERLGDLMQEWSKGLRDDIEDDD